MNRIKDIKEFLKDIFSGDVVSTLDDNEVQALEETLEEIDSDIRALENTLFKNKRLYDKYTTGEILLVDDASDLIIKKFNNKNEFVEFVKDFMARNFD